MRLASAEERLSLEPMQRLRHRDQIDRGSMEPLRSALATSIGNAFVTLCALGDLLCRSHRYCNDLFEKFCEGDGGLSVSGRAIPDRFVVPELSSGKIVKQVARIMRPKLRVIARVSGEAILKRHSVRPRHLSLPLQIPPSHTSHDRCVRARSPDPPASYFP